MEKANVCLAKILKNLLGKSPSEKSYTICRYIISLCTVYGTHNIPYYYFPALPQSMVEISINISDIDVAVKHKYNMDDATGQSSDVILINLFWREMSEQMIYSAIVAQHSIQPKLFCLWALRNSVVSPRYSLYRWIQWRIGIRSIFCCIQTHGLRNPGLCIIHEAKRTFEVKQLNFHRFLISLGRNNRVISAFSFLLTFLYSEEERCNISSFWDFNFGVSCYIIYSTYYSRIRFLSSNRVLADCS